MRGLVITGAGVSAESGISTFRGKDGYWRNLDPTKLATPKAFARDPDLVWDWYRERRQCIRKAQPNSAHRAIANLALQAGEFLLVTQNVDDLHLRAKRFWSAMRLRIALKGAGVPQFTDRWPLTSDPGDYGCSG